MIRIGITTSFEQGEQRLSRDYVRAVASAGGLPLVAPMGEQQTILAFANLLDGLVVTGGPAITKNLIGALPDDIREPDPVRSDADALLLRACLDRRLPVLGICYGMQLLNALCGGSIYADVQRDQDGSLAHSEKRGASDHPVELMADSRLRRILGAERLMVNTRHIQAVAHVAPCFRVAARASDNVVEAFENEDATLLGVQFHPEKMGTRMQPLFRHLIERASQTRRARARPETHHPIHAA